MKKDLSLMEEVRDALLSVSTTLCIDVQQVTKAQLINNSEISDHKLRKLGGLQVVKNKYFPVTNKQLADIHDSGEVIKYIRKLERELGKSLAFEKHLKEAIDKHIKPVKLHVYKPRGKLKPDIKRQLVCMLNDVHYGLQVKKEEVSGVNEYNWTIASRRTAYFVEQVCNYKKDKRSLTDAVNLIINGDLIAGVIHGLSSRDNDLLVYQFNGAIHILTHAIAKFAENFRKVNVHFAVGNHGDMPHRREGGRVISQVYDNYEAAIFYALSVAFRNIKTITFNINKSIYNGFNLPAGRLLFTHGHILFSRELGNPGNKVDTRSLSDAIMRFNNGEREKGLDTAKLLLLGHTHTNIYFTTPDGIQVFNAPSLSGIDNYAFSLGINHNQISQLLFESTHEHIFGDSRLVDVSKADKLAYLDAIIPPYNYDLSWND